MSDLVMKAIAKMIGRMRKVNPLGQASWARGCQRMYAGVLDYCREEVKLKLVDVAVAEVVVEGGRDADNSVKGCQCQ